MLHVSRRTCISAAYSSQQAAGETASGGPKLALNTRLATQTAMYRDFGHKGAHSLKFSPNKLIIRFQDLSVIGYMDAVLSRSGCYAILF
jgi:hypothetical protein